MLLFISTMKLKLCVIHIAYSLPGDSPSSDYFTFGIRFPELIFNDDLNDPTSVHYNALKDRVLSNVSVMELL